MDEHIMRHKRIVDDVSLQNKNLRLQNNFLVWNGMKLSELSMTSCAIHDSNVNCKVYACSEWTIMAYSKCDRNELILSIDPNNESKEIEAKNFEEPQKSLLEF